MDTAKLKKFAQFARRSLLEQVSAKLKLVLAENSAARRESTEAVKKLVEAIQADGQEQVVERVAYIWFNRFCALRFMDVNRYNRVNIVSPADPGQFQPEILAEAKMGHIDDEMVHDKVRQQIFALLDGKAPSRDPQGEAYRLLVVAACNYWNKAMPFLFQRIDDYTELLMPDDLLSGNSILAYTREAMTPDACEDVEVIGWLYQFYISEKKDEVFDGLKKNKKITPENIPAATQLFTPHWIVRYLVENSLGRLWMQNRPNSKLKERMEYYIAPVASDQWLVASEEKSGHWPLTTSHSEGFLLISNPEEIRICDPACGSGHMLTYAFDLLYAIYEEEGYEPAEIPEKILANNLFGIEIDERAGELAAFALTMKARAKQRRFFNKGVKPNICVLEKLVFDENELVVSDQWPVASGASREDILHDLNLFEEADNFGSLIRPRLTSEQCTKLRDYLTGHWSLATSHSLFDRMTHQKVLQALRQADYLSPKYHVVIANPPYMGGKGMNGRLGAWAKGNYPNSKSDLMTMFMERAPKLCLQLGTWAMINLPSWMFLGSFEKFRNWLVSNQTFSSLVHLGRGVFGSDFGSVAFVLNNATPKADAVATYRRLFDVHVQVRDVETIKDLYLDYTYNRYNFKQSDFSAIPGNPIAYWLSRTTVESFAAGHPLSNFADFKHGMSTSDNNRFLRFWHEVSQDKSNYEAVSKEDTFSEKRWYPYQKGGEFRKWYGNHSYVVNWQNDGEEIREISNIKYPYLKGNLDFVLGGQRYFFTPGYTWTSLTAGSFSLRKFENGFLFDAKGQCFFPKDEDCGQRLYCMLNSKVSTVYCAALTPTVDFNSGVISKIPFPEKLDIQAAKRIRELAHLFSGIARNDWDSNEFSWDFGKLPLLNADYRQPSLKATYQKLRAHWREMTLEMQRLEQENNRIFIEAYGLNDELDENVDLNEITLTCNPHYRYGNDKSEEELEALLLADTMRELVSYAVGCMFGRYSLDKPGLILANQGETLADFVRKVASDQWPVSSNSGESNECETLQGSDCLAESHGSGAVGLSSNQDLSQGGTVRLDQSGAAGGGLDSIQHSGRASASIVSGVQKLSVDSEGIVGGSGNTTADRNAAQLSNSGTTSTNHGDPSGNQQNDPGADGKTGHWPLTTSHLSFVPDEDNVIPMLDGDWFTDDIAERFRKFLRVAFGEEHYEENLRFVEQALGKNGKARDIRDYFLKDFYSDHVRRYKKRPIYWLFSSPKGSFNALIYMHRYRPDTVSVVLNDYLREFRTKLSSHKNHLEAVSISASSSQGEKTKALKEIEKITKMIAEMEEYERDVLYPLATEQVAIDLDDGVKVNYLKLGAALKKIPGLDTTED